MQTTENCTYTNGGAMQQYAITASSCTSSTTALAVQIQNASTTPIQINTTSFGIVAGVFLFVMVFGMIIQALKR